MPHDTTPAVQPIVETSGCTVNEDREVWSAGCDYRDERVHITKENGIGISVGGVTIVKTAAGWHKCSVMRDAYDRALASSASIPHQDR